MEICLIGCTGAGKTRLAGYIEQQYGLAHISSGEIARELAQADPAARIALQAGHYAPEGAVRIAIQRRIEAAMLQHGGYVLEGFPRTLAQLAALLNWVDVEPTFVHTDCSIYECILRLSRRGRDDDLPDGIATKVQNYEQQTLPLLGTLEAAGRLYTIDTSGNGEAEKAIDNLLGATL